MATNTRRDVELRITANDQPVEDLIGAFERLLKTQNDLVKSGDITQRSYRELKADLTELQAIGQQLASRGALLDYFRTQSDALQTLSGRLDAAKTKLAEVRASQASSGTVTKAQAKELQGLQTAVDKTQEKFDRLSNRVAETRTQLTRLGMGDVDAAQQQLIATADRVGAAIQTATDQVRGYDAALREKRAAEAAAAQSARELAEATERQRTLDAQVAQTATRRIAQERAEAAAAREAARAIAEGNAARRTRLAQAVEVFVQSEALRIERERTTEAQRRLAVERQQAAAARETARALAAENAARRSRLAQSVDVFANASAQNLRRPTARADVVGLGDLATGVRDLDRTRRGLLEVEGAANRAGRGFQFFRDEGRTTLSLTQRLRGQVLALGAAYVGFYQTISTAQRALTVASERQAALRKLAVANGNDLTRAAEDYAYVREQALRLGLAFTDLAKNYGDIRVAGTQAGLSLEQQRTIFESFAEAARVFNLSAENTNGIFKALEQILSKGSIQMEELRGQLGDRLTGVFTQAAKAIGLTTAELVKLIENGGLSSKALVAIGEQFRELVADQLPTATQSFEATIERLRTRFEDFLERIANSGFKQAVTDLAADLSTFFESDDGERFAQRIATGFSIVVNVLRAVVEHGGTLYTLFKAYLALRLGQWFAGVASAAAQTVAQIRLLRTEAAAGTATVRTFGAALSSLAGGLIGVALYAVAEAIFAITRRAREAREATEALNDALRQLRTREGDALDSAIGAQRASLDEMQDQVVKATETLAAAEKRLASAQATYAVSGGADTPGMRGNALGSEVSQARAEVERARTELQTLRRNAIDLQIGIQTAEFRSNAARAKDVADGAKRLAALDAELNATGNAQKLASDKAYFKSKADELRAAEKLLSRISEEQQDEDTRATLERLRLRVGKARAALYGIETADGGDKKAADKAARAAETARKRDARAEIREAQQIADERARLNEQADAKVRELNKALAKSDADELRSRLDQIGIEIDKRREELTSLVNQLAANGDIARAAQVEDELGKLDVLQKQQEVQARLEVGQARLNQLQAALSAEIEAANAKMQVGVSTELEGRREILSIQQRYQASILAAITNLRALLTSLPQDVFQQLGGAELLAQLDGLQTKTENFKTRIRSLGEEVRRFADDNLVQWVDGFVNAFAELGKGIAGLIQGVNDAGDAWVAFRDAARSAIADTLVEVGKLILRYILLRALSSLSGSSNSFLTAIGNAAGASVGSQHSGGIVRHARPKRFVPAEWFARARRYHNGGVAGLAPNEVPTVLETGEEVLTRRDPRHSANGGGRTPIQLNIINQIDSGSVVQQGLKTAPGQESFYNFLRANKSKVKSVLA